MPVDETPKPAAAAAKGRGAEIAAERRREAGALNSAILGWHQEFSSRQSELMNATLSELTALAQSCLQAGDASSLREKQAAYAQALVRRSVECNRLSAEWMFGLARLAFENVADAAANASKTDAHPR